ncbi:hypothetical protein [Arthrobacter sp. ZGTC212]|uniref:hypothetical protein n=1 Tax=Arthrobacter sp. ZGTC212 TaxID=2058899 RepID=UPI000CE57B1F|nr:hypothetical protein [Arthrobacter sp. ZGTC212]
MKSLRALKAAGLIIAAVVLGLMTVQGSYALWNAAVSAPAATIQAADFSILVNGNDMRGTQVPLNIGELARGGAAYTSLTVKNNVNASSAVRIQPSLTGLVPVDNFGGNLTVKTVLAAGVQCSAISAATYDAAPRIPVMPPLAIGATQSVCFKVELKSGTPAGYLGQSIDIPIALNVAQIPPTQK